MQIVAWLQFICNVKFAINTYDLFIFFPIVSFTSDLFAALFFRL